MPVRNFCLDRNGMRVDGLGGDLGGRLSQATFPNGTCRETVKTSWRTRVDQVYDLMGGKKWLITA